MLPEELDEVLNNMEVIRNKMKGDFATKVNRLNKITKVLTVSDGSETIIGRKAMAENRNLFSFCILFHVAGYVYYHIFPFHDLQNSFVNLTVILTGIFTL